MGRAKSMATAMRFRPVLAREIPFWHNRQPFDVVLTVGCTMWPYARILTHPGCRQSALKCPPAQYPLDVSSRDAIRWYEYAARAWPPRRWICAAEARRLGRIEAGNADLFDAVLFHSEAVKMVCHRLGARSQSAVVVPNGVDLDTFVPSPLGDDRTILCLGPAREHLDLCGPRWFADFVLPLLQHRVPDSQWWWILLTRAQEILPVIWVFTWWTMVQMYAYIYIKRHCWLPHRANTLGVQQRILESMACAQAVVRGPHVATGLKAMDGQDWLTAPLDNPGRFARQVYRVLARVHRCKQIAAHARRFVERSHTWDRTFGSVVELVDGGVSPSRYSWAA